MASAIVISNSDSYLHNLSLFCLKSVRSRDSSVGIETGYGAGRPGYDSRQGQEISLLHCVQTGSGAHPSSQPMGTGGSFPKVKRQEREADHSPPSSAEVKNGGAIRPLPHMSS
jgi:hypothetical protein